jgi:hypothetical protein
MINTQKLILMRTIMSYSSKDVMYNANLKEIINDIAEQINAQGGTAIVGNPDLQIGSSSAAKIKNDAFYVVRDGVVSTIASTETAFTATTHDIADGYEAIFNVYLDADNTITLLKGTEVATAVPAVSVCPATPSGGLKIGEVKVATAAAAFDASTTELSAGTVTDTYTNTTDSFIEFSDYSAKNWLYHSHLKDLLEDLVDIVQNDGVARLISNPNLAIGTSSAAKVKTDAFSFILDGEITEVATAETAFTATTHDLTDGQEAIYVLSVDPSDSSLTLTMGTAVTSASASAVAPATPTGELKLGEVLIATSGAAFDASTTELSAGTVTDTYTNKTDAVSTADFDISNYDLEDYRYSDNFYDLLDDIEEDINRVSNDKLLKNPTLVIGSSSAAKVKNSAFDVMRDGVISTVASTETAFTATTDDIADGYGAIFNVYLDATNTIKMLKGTATALGTGAVCPATPTGGMKIGEVKVVTSGAAFDASTTLLSAATVTDTYTNKIDIFEEVS